MTLTVPVAVVLDTSPLGLLTQKIGHVGGDACKAWYAPLEVFGCRFFVPEIADYELRRELLRVGNAAAIVRLDAFLAAESDRFLPLTTPAVRLAASLWAQTRRAGRVTADPKALDVDVLVAAQARLLNPTAFGFAAVVVATENVSHFQGLVTAELWSRLAL